MKYLILPFLGIKVNCLDKLYKKYIGRWVPVSEALPPENIGVLVARNNLDAPAFAWLKYAAGDIRSPFFICPASAGLEKRGLGNELIVYTHWFSPCKEGLPIFTHSLHSEWGLGHSSETHQDGWFDTSNYKEQLQRGTK
jgi:hypothetical protein